MNRDPAAIVWKITLFGGLAIRDGKGRAVEVPGRKDRALLGFLAAAPGIPHLRERLAALLRGDSGERPARDPEPLRRTNFQFSLQGCTDAPSPSPPGPACSRRVADKLSPSARSLGL